MKTSEQIKGAIRNISKKTGVNPNSLLQMCLFEGILEKISKSKYRENFILKGGLLISSLIGVNVRSTMDMDTTLRGIPLNEVSITNILNEILAIEIDADIEYKLIKLSPIRQEDVYEDFCAKMDVEVANCEIWEKGGEGGKELVEKVLNAIEKNEKSQTLNT